MINGSNFNAFRIIIYIEANNISEQKRMLYVISVFEYKYDVLRMQLNAPYAINIILIIITNEYQQNASRLVYLMYLIII